MERGVGNDVAGRWDTAQAGAEWLVIGALGYVLLVDLKKETSYWDVYTMSFFVVFNDLIENPTSSLMESQPLESHSTCPR